ncbi:hypothetical protein [Novosphingobium sp. BL-8H]|uniref:hypothetical protein n=1 Tax=Novosphingobium sp. BL-8H TaxID=3127640 RepID=UPI003756EEFA
MPAGREFSGALQQKQRIHRIMYRHGDDRRAPVPALAQIPWLIVSLPFHLRSFAELRFFL